MVIRLVWVGVFNEAHSLAPVKCLQAHLDENDPTLFPKGTTKNG